MLPPACRVAASNKLSVATYMAQNNISPREARYHADGLSPAASELASMTSEEPGERTPLTRRSPLPLARLSARQADVREAGSDHASHGAHGASWLPPPHASSSTGRECDAEGASAHGAEIEDAPDACDDLGAIPEHEEADHGPVRQNDLGRSSIGAGSGAGSRLGRSSASRRILDTILPKATRQSLSRHSANTLLGAMQVGDLMMGACGSCLPCAFPVRGSIDRAFFGRCAGKDGNSNDRCCSAQASQTHQRDSGNESTPSKAGRLARVSGAPVRHRPASISRLSAPVGPRRPSSYLRAGGQGSQQAARSRMGGSAGEKRGSGRSPPTDEAPARAEKEAEMPGPSGDIPMDLLFAKLGYGGREDAGTGSATGER